MLLFIAQAQAQDKTPPPANNLVVSSDRSQEERLLGCIGKFCIGFDKADYAGGLFSINLETWEEKELEGGPTTQTPIIWGAIPTPDKQKLVIVTDNGLFIAYLKMNTPTVEFISLLKEEPDFHRPVLAIVQNKLFIGNGKELYAHNLDILIKNKIDDFQTINFSDGIEAL